MVLRQLLVFFGVVDEHSHVDAKNETGAFGVRLGGDIHEQELVLRGHDACLHVKRSAE